MARKKMSAADKAAFVARMAAARKKTRKKSTAPARKKNGSYLIVVIGPNNERGYYTGKNYDTEKSKAKPYATQNAAVSVAQNLDIARGWKIAVETPK